MSTELSEDQIKQILQGIKVPSQPQILVDLQMEQWMPEPDMRQIAKLISQDVGLSGTMLKFVNSPFFGLANKITSIEQAVSLLGLNSVINILNGLSIKGEMSDEKISALTQFWDTANDIAMVSATIAKKIGFKNPDEAYALGLFHNVGIPLMMSRFNDYKAIMEESYSGSSDRIIDAENSKYNTNHCVIGYYTAKAWNLPKVICEAISQHHSALSLFLDNDGKSQEKKTLMAILKIAEHICCNYATLGNQTEDFEWQSLATEVLEYIGLSTYDIEEMKENFRDMGINVSVD